ncbi:MAG: hypothetical protein M0R50_09610 [Candidatus Cloacimonetes bacterium]|jgi:predicted  nucleic acid-binding Zn-ribbon protein|nr:hypothetical protein [Candidatus Cloacimonadota bacterium]
MSLNITYWEDYLGALDCFEKVWLELRERLSEYPCVSTKDSPHSFSELGSHVFDIAGYCEQTVDEYIEAIDSLAILLRSIDQETVENTLLPRSINKDLASGLDELCEAAKSLSECLSKESFSIAIQHKNEAEYCINISDSKLVVGNSGKSISNFLTLLANAYGKAIIAAKTIIMLLDKVSPLLYKNYIEGKRQYATELVQLKGDIKSVSRTAKEQAAHIKEYFDEIEEIKKHISSMENNAKNNFDSIKTILDESEATQVELRSLVKGNEDLGDELEELKEEATAFNDEIDSMKQNHAGEMAKVDKLLLDLAEKYNKFSTDIDAKAKAVYSDIKSLSERADSMLSGATNAALASTFDDKRKEASGELVKTLRFYVVSIIFLVISVIPLAYVLFEMSIGNLSIQPWTILPTIILVMPGLFLQHFAASRYADTFRILEDYTYKYSIAMGVEGYKKAAPEYADEIAASTFEQIAFNPADNLRGQKQVQMVAHPILELLATKMGFALIRTPTPDQAIKFFTNELFKYMEKKFNYELSKTCQVLGDEIDKKCLDKKN